MENTAIPRPMNIDENGQILKNEHSSVLTSGFGAHSSVSNTTINNNNNNRTDADNLAAKQIAKDITQEFLEKSRFFMEN